MANLNSVFGARYFNNFSSVRPALHPYVVPATDGTALFVGDFVKLVGTSSLTAAGEYLPVVTQAAATETLVGWVAGFGETPDALEKIYRPASTLKTVWVYDDPYACFEIQAAGTRSSGDEGNNADIVVGSGSTVTGLSGMQIADALGAGTAQLRLVRLSPKKGAEYGLYTKFICFINEHAYKGTTGV